jgi:hypothetical protein
MVSVHTTTATSNSIDSFGQRKSFAFSTGILSLGGHVLLLGLVFSRSARFENS